MSCRRKPVSTVLPHERLTSGSRRSPGRQLVLMVLRDPGFVLCARRHGESALLVLLLTSEPGGLAGLVRGGQTPRRRAAARTARQQRRGSLAQARSPSIWGHSIASWPRRTPRASSTPPPGSRRSAPLPRCCCRHCQSARRTPISTGPVPGYWKRQTSVRMAGELESYLAWECDLLD